MTKEEAIKIIDCYDIGFYDLSGEKIPADKLADALDMAIEALSAKPQTDYISRADAIKAIRKCKFDSVMPSDWYRGMECAQDIIEDIPSADAVHGEWIKKQVFNPELDKYVPFIECSVCGYEPYYGGSESKFNYCANCGARMEK